jgi:hypothetical protein
MRRHVLDKDQDLVESCPTESRFWESRNEKVELISSSVTPNKASIFEEPRLTKEENEEATHN